jgi:ribosomal protein S27E
MSLPDSAEYWWDVKGYNRTIREPFTHIKGIDCSHYHVHESLDIKDINCRCCRKILAEMSDIKIDIANKLEQHLYLYGKCSCGRAFVKRINKANGNPFLGCRNYPKCKNTKPFKQQ